MGRIEHIDGIQLDENDIEFIDDFCNAVPGTTVESHWDEFTGIMSQLHTALERKRDNTLMLMLRCVPCDLKFQNPIPILQPIDQLFKGICCPQCGGEDINTSGTLNYRDWEKKQKEVTLCHSETP